MDDDSRSGKAIIPDDKRRELSLPFEMIHRGLELAIWIERKQGVEPIQPSAITPARKGHLVQSHLSFMEWYRTPDGSEKLREPENEPYPPVYLRLYFDSHGLHVSCVSEGEMPDLAGMRGNADRYRLLNAFNHEDPFTIPVSSLGLYYVLSRPMQFDHLPPGLSSHLPPEEEWRNFSFRLGPTGQPGYKGPVTKEANPNFDINRDCVEIVLVYVATLQVREGKRHLVSKNPPVKLTFTVIDSNGEDDSAATRELYHVLLEARSRVSDSP